MNGIKAIFDDAHGLLGLALIIAATVLAAIGIMPLDMWKSYTQIIFGVFAGAHAVITGSGFIASSKAANSDMLAGLAQLAKSYIASKNEPGPTSAPTPEPVPASEAPKTPQAGHILAPVILFLMVIGVCLGTMIVLSCSAPCDPSKAACVAQNSVITCGETEVAQVILDHGDEITKVITGATNPADGSVNWSSISSQLEAYALKYGSCVIAQIFDHYVSSKTTVLVAGTYKIPTSAAARDGFNQLRTKLWPGKTFKLSNGHVL